MSSMWGIRGRSIRQASLIALLATLLFSASARLVRAQSAPSAPVPTVRDAAAALAAGELNRADRELQTVLKKSPTNVHALNLLGIVRVEQGREKEAEGLFQ